jgi:hypothetical protein
LSPKARFISLKAISERPRLEPLQSQNTGRSLVAQKVLHGHLNRISKAASGGLFWDYRPKKKAACFAPRERPVGKMHEKGRLGATPDGFLMRLPARLRFRRICA